MGLDVGNARIGVAVTDSLGKIAQPLETVARDGSEFKRVAELVENSDVGLIVLGLPLLLDGSEGEQAGAVRNFAEELRENIDIEITFFDERLTTKQAAKITRAVKKKPGKKGDLDRIAASLMLDAFINRRLDNDHPE